MSRGTQQSILSYVVDTTTTRVDTLEALLKKAPAQLLAGLTSLLGAHRARERRRPVLADLAREHPPSHQYIATVLHKGVVCAVARANVERHHAEVSLVHVAAPYRGRGLCGRVMRALLVGTPATHFHLEVDPKNSAARACYTGAGFAMVAKGRFIEYSRTMTTAERLKLSTTR